MGITFQFIKAVVSPCDPLQDNEQELVQHLQRDLGEYFKLLATYYGSGVRPLYIDQIGENHVTNSTNAQTFDVEGLVDGLQEGSLSQESIQPEILGEYRCSLYLYEQWLLFHYQKTDSGVVIGVDARSASNLRDFLRDLSPVVDSVL